MEFKTWFNTNFDENLKMNAFYDISKTAYDYDGYMMVGSVSMNDDPTTNVALTTTKGYIYLCMKDGYDTKGMTCAYTIGTAAEMALNTNVGTATSTTKVTVADFNEVLTGTQVPVQFDLATSFTNKTCKFNDGTAGCWGSKFTYALNASKFEVYYYMLRQQKDGATPAERDIDTAYGFRYNPGDKTDMGIVMSKDGATGNQNHFGVNFTLQGATSTILGSAALVAGVLSTMF